MISFSTDDLRTPESLERVLRQFASSIQTVPVSILPSLSQLASQLAPLLRNQFQAGGSTPLNLQSLLPVSASGGIAVVDTHANRLVIYPASNYAVGQLFYETDRTDFYVVTMVAGVLTWTWADGMYRNTLANIPVDLGTADTNFLFEVTDYSHTLLWSGSAWIWGPDDDGSDYYRMYENAPSGFGALAWQVCDGSTVARLNANGTTTNVTVPNLATAAYLKGGTAAAAVAVASGNTPTGTVAAPVFTGTAGTTGNDGDAGTTVLSAGAVLVANNPHTHPFTPAGTNSAPAFTGNAMTTLELRNKQTGLYYRR